MQNELVRYARGEMQPSKADRPIAKEAKGIYHRAQLKALEADGQLALAAHAMQGIAKLDQHRKALCSPEDETLDNLLRQIEMDAFERVRTIACGPRPSQSNPWLF